MISQEMVKYKDTEMYVTRHCDTPAAAVASLPAATVEVSNIPGDFRQDTLLMLFENSKRSGGGEIDNVDYVERSGKALITFKDSAGICLVTCC